VCTCGAARRRLGVALKTAFLLCLRHQIAEIDMCRLASLTNSLEHRGIDRSDRAWSGKWDANIGRRRHEPADDLAMGFTSSVGRIR